ncbi:MAG: tetratricopeptide repeat protein [Sedimentisphaerales bacterium]|nr:tetratricopeptide repeat protein [Sedimentisphaerales bacterium]
MNAKKNILIILLLIMAVDAGARLTGDDFFAEYNRANESFRRANESSGDPQEAQKLYEKAILSYEKIINEGRIQNSKLYYNLANSYLLSNNIAKAILNYRRAEKLDPSDANIQKNLAFARSRRIDKVKLQTEKRVLHTLFFWHYDFSIKTRFIISSVSFAIVALCLTAMLWFGRFAWGKVITTIITIMLICCFSSVLIETIQSSKNIPGVIIAEEVIARQGDSDNYPQSFKDPLHAGTEFELIESRTGWLHIRLADNSDAWIPNTSADLI